MTWVATREELREDFLLMQEAHYALEPVETNARIAFHDNTQEAVKVLTPAPRFIAALLAGNYIKNKRVIGECEHTGAPIFEGRNEVLPPLDMDQAIGFLIWKDLPKGCNNYKIMTTDDLPRIDGDIDKARKFRAAWRLQEETV